MGHPREVCLFAIRLSEERHRLERPGPRRIAAQRGDRSRRAVLAPVDLADASRTGWFLLIVRCWSRNAPQFPEQVRRDLRDHRERARLHVARDRSLQGLRGAPLPYPVFGLGQQVHQDVCPDRLDLRWRGRQPVHGGRAGTGRHCRLIAATHESRHFRRRS